MPGGRLTEVSVLKRCPLREYNYFESVATQLLKLLQIGLKDFVFPQAIFHYEQAAQYYKGEESNR